MTHVRTDRPDLLPSARDAEMMLVGAALLDPAQYDACSRIVAPDDFEVPLNRLAWQAIGRRREAGQAVDYALVSADVNATGAFDSAGAATVDAGLTECLTVVPNAWHAPEYARLVADASTRRGIIAGAATVAQWAHEGSDDVAGMVAGTLRVFEALDTRTAFEESGDIRPALDMLDRGALPRGYSSGVACYDEWTPGLRPQEVHTIAGYTGGGKTWLMCQVANSLIDQGARVAIFSLEMPAGAFVPRMLANRAGGAALRWGRPGATFESGEAERIRQAATVLSDASEAGRLAVYFDQTNIHQIAAIVRQTRPDAVFVDYVQLMDDPAPRMSEYEATTANAKALQRLAKKAHCTVVMLSQVNEDHQRSAGASRALGLKSSGAIGAVSDLVLYVQATDEPGIIKLSARKARHGPDANAGSVAEYRMDKATGKLLPKLAVVAPSAYSEGYMGRTAVDA